MKVLAPDWSNYKGTKDRQYLHEKFILGVMMRLTLAPKEGHRGSCSHCAAPQSGTSQHLPGRQAKHQAQGLWVS